VKKQNTKNLNLNKLKDEIEQVSIFKVFLSLVSIRTAYNATITV
jgi:hypothetical protein